MGRAIIREEGRQNAEHKAKGHTAGDFVPLRIFEIIPMKMKTTLLIQHFPLYLCLLLPYFLLYPCPISVRP